MTRTEREMMMSEWRWYEISHLRSSEVTVVAEKTVRRDNGSYCSSRRKYRKKAEITIIASEQIKRDEAVEDTVIATEETKRGDSILVGQWPKCGVSNLKEINQRTDLSLSVL